jgi:hypothetical protein
VAVLSYASFCTSGSTVGGSVVPVLTGGTGESPVVPIGQIPAELFFAVTVLVIVPVDGPVVPVLTSGTGKSPVIPVGYFLAKSPVG